MSKARTIASQLAAERERLFVGRDDELRRLDALLDPESPRRVACVSGPGGAGKTELLSVFAARASARGAKVAWVDGAEVLASESAFAGAVATALANEGEVAAPELVFGSTLLAVFVLVIDRFELIASLESWFRDRFLPSLGAAARIVFAGRAPRAPAWAANPAWSTLLDAIQLGDLSPPAAADYLARRGIPEARRADILRAAGGNPMALALFSDLIARGPGRPLDLGAKPELVQALLERLLDAVPDDLHRRALWSLACVSHTTEETLAATVTSAEAPKLFDYLRRLSFVRGTPHGLVPHELIRDLLARDLAWRHPHLRREVLGGAARHYRALLARYPEEGAFVFHETAFLWRAELPVAGYEPAGLSVSAPRPDDWPELAAMMTRCHGAASSELLRHWAARGGELIVIRALDERPQALALYLPLDRLRAEDVAKDPGVARLCAHLGGATTGAVFQRWLVDRDAGEAPAPSTTLAIRWEFERFISTRGVREGYNAWLDPDNGLTGMPPGMLERLEAADFTLDGRRYRVIGTTARGRDMLAWTFEGLFAPLGAANAGAGAEIDRESFDRAVRAALKEFHRSERLVGNALVRTALVAGPGVNGLDATEVVRAAIREGCEALGPAGDFDRAILERTYLTRRVKQMRVAIELNLPYSSFRRHLANATARLAERLWLRATNALGSPSEP